VPAPFGFSPFDISAILFTLKLPEADNAREARMPFSFSAKAGRFQSMSTRTARAAAKKLTAMKTAMKRPPLYPLKTLHSMDHIWVEVINLFIPTYTEDSQEPVASREIAPHSSRN
jgi:hypothetical protein